MVVKLKPIKDPGLKDKDGKQTSIAISPPILEKMTMRRLDVKLIKNNKLEDITKKAIPPDSKLSSLPVIGGEKMKFNCTSICEKVLENIESVDKQNKYFCIGKGQNRMFCGNVIHMVPMGSFARIGSGHCVCLPSPPVNKDGTFKYEKDKLLAVKVNKNKGTDYLIVVASNGCILIDADASASFNMPVWVVEQTGEYYQLNKGQRIFSLMPGHHMLIYTYQAPILFPKVDYKAKTILRPVISTKIEEKTPKENIKSDEKEKVKSTEKSPKINIEPKKVEKKKEELKKPEPHKQESKDDHKEESEKEKSKKPELLKQDSKDDLKEESEKEEPKQSVQTTSLKPILLTPPPTPSPSEPVQDGDTSGTVAAEAEAGIPFRKIIGLVAAVVIGLLLLYLLVSGSNGEDNSQNKTPKKK